MSEVEERLRSMVKKCEQCLRDFAYYYRALCLMEVGSMVKKECSVSKEYWQKVHENMEKSGKKIAHKKPFQRATVELSVVQCCGYNTKEPNFLVVPITIRGIHNQAIVDTWSTFTLMRESLWK